MLNSFHLYSYNRLIKIKRKSHVYDHLFLKKKDSLLHFVNTVCVNKSFFFWATNLICLKIDRHRNNK